MSLLSLFSNVDGWISAAATTTNNGSGALSTTTLTTITVPDNATTGYDIRVFGRVAGNGAAMGWARDGMVARDASGTVTLSGASGGGADDIPGTVTIATTASGSNQIITAAITTGTADQVIYWTVFYRTFTLS